MSRNHYEIYDVLYDLDGCTIARTNTGLSPLIPHIGERVVRYNDPRKQWPCRVTDITYYTSPSLQWVVIKLELIEEEIIHER